MKLLFGVPQGSLLVPILFILYTKALQKIAAKYGLDIKLYAYDSQLYIGFNPSITDDLVDVKGSISNCLREMKNWMLENFMKLNENKTQLLVFGKPHILKMQEASFHIKFEDIIISQTLCKGDNGKSLGVKLDETLSMDRQIAEVKKNCSWTMMNMRTIGHYLNESIKILLVKQLVISKLDYRNALYINLTKKRLKKLSSILNTAVRFIYNIKDKNEDLIPYYKKAHILPLHQSIQYTICLLAHKAVHGTSPDYIKDLLPIHQPQTLTRSKTANDPDVPDLFQLKLKKSSLKRGVSPSMLHLPGILCLSSSGTSVIQICSRRCRRTTFMT